MNDFTPEAQRALSREAIADLMWLIREHGINGELINSLKAGKEEARAHLRFFKRMMFVSNGAVMAVGLAIAGFGVKSLMDNRLGFLGNIFIVIGVVLFLKFVAVFAGMVRGIKAAEAVARKHDLI